MTGRLLRANSYDMHMKIALTADWIMAAGGAEQVISAFAETFPQAPIFTTVAADLSSGSLATSTVHTSSLQRWYRLFGKHQPLLPWMPRAMESFDLSGYDVILSSSHAVGKGILPPPDGIHVCYCHTPMRYAWFMEEDYLRDFHIPHFLWPLIKRRLSIVRTWDLATSKRVDLFLANSETTARRIKEIYGRESVVIHPPVDDHFFDVPLRRSEEDPYVLAVGRLVPYKRFDLLIDAANAEGIRLKIAGSGQDEAALKKRAGPTVEFLGYVHDDALPPLYANAEALLFPQEEDAGIVLLEAQACGTPVIAYGAGGAVDLTKEGVSSVLFPTQTDESVVHALKEFRARSWDRTAIRKRVRDCMRSNFNARISRIVTETYDQFNRGTFRRT